MNLQPKELFKLTEKIMKSIFSQKIVNTLLNSLIFVNKDLILHNYLIQELEDMIQPLNGQQLIMKILLMKHQMVILNQPKKDILIPTCPLFIKQLLLNSIPMQLVQLLFLKYQKTLQKHLLIKVQKILKLLKILYQKFQPKKIVQIHQ